MVHPKKAAMSICCWKKSCMYQLTFMIDIPLSLESFNHPRWCRILSNNCIDKSEGGEADDP